MIEAHAPDWTPGFWNAIPDAFEPALSRHLHKSATVPNRFAQRQRRANILAATRAELAEHGYLGVTIRRVSDRAAISPQTIHNLVGPRDRMIASAVCEHIDTMIGYAREGLSERWFLLALARSFGLCAEHNADYIREASKTYYPPDQPLHDAILETAYRQILGGVNEMQARGQLRLECNPSTLTKRVMSSTNGILLEWISGSIRTTEILSELIQGYMPLLQFALTDEEFAAVRRAVAVQGETPRHS